MVDIAQAGKMNSTRLIQFCASLEQKLDTRLFGNRADEDAPPPSRVARVVGGAGRVAKGVATAILPGAALYTVGAMGGRQGNLNRSSLARLGQNVKNIGQTRGRDIGATIGRGAEMATAAARKGVAMARPRVSTAAAVARHGAGALKGRVGNLLRKVTALKK